jgi:hypothetical protein
MPFIRFLSSIFDRLFVIAGALCGCQIPIFILQYTQRLAGHVDELNRLLTNLRGLANQSHKTLDQYIAKFLESSDLDFASQGEFMLGVVNRWEQLNRILQDLMTSNLWSRPFVFIKGLQWDIATSTLHDFQPGIQLTPEGLIYMAIGAILGFCFYQFICKMIGLFGFLCRITFTKLKNLINFS